MAYLSAHDIHKLVIHCADTPNGDDRFTISRIDEWHCKRGFARSEKARRTSNTPNIYACGYHFVIHIDGTLRIGRETDEKGAHVKKWNSKSLGVCLIGRDKFTPPQWKALGSLIRKLKDKYPIASIDGHCDLDKRKTCPGFSVSAWLKNDLVPLPNFICEIKE